MTAPDTNPLPTTYDAATTESTWYARWSEHGVFTADAARAATREPFVIVIPPPNVTAVLHMGHGLNNTVQDVLIRWRRMAGDEALWLPGTDHAGIATQNVVEKQLAAQGQTRFDVGRGPFVEKVAEFVEHTGGEILNQLKAIGSSADWSRTAYTFSPALSKSVREAFVRLHEDGLVYKGHRVIHWCPRCGTSLSDEEAEFTDTTGKLYHLKYVLADDPTLEPRDVLVMCPDIEAYAPLVQAAFGLGLGDVVGDPTHPAHRLRVRLADRALSSTNPLLAVAARLLDLAGGRATASEVVDLAHEPAVRRRFGLRDDDLQQLTSWVRSTGVRWAFDADHRADFGLGSVVSHTWEFGLDRLLAGVAMSDDTGAWLDRTLPLDDVGSGQVDLAGRVVEMVRRLREVTDRLVGTHSLEHWLATLAEGLVALTSVAPADSWQSGQVQRELARVREAAAERGAVDLRLPDVRALLSDRLGGRPTRANFRTGTLTVSTLVPMRSVPHRVICLVGLDDGVFPRVGALDGDDVLARDAVTGERDPRSEDRQLFLDAVLAATETLVVTCTGANEFSGQPRPPAVPVGELLDALDLTATPPPGADTVADAVSVEHPLQPFDERNFTAGALGAPTPFSFDAVALTAAGAARGEREPVPPLLTGPLPPAPAADVQLDDLVTFFCRRGGPVAGFLSAQRLDLALPREDDPLLDALPVELDQLQRWQVGDRLLHDLLAGADPEQARQQEWRRGELPPGQLGWRLLTELVSQVVPIAEEVARLRTRPATQVDVDVDLGGGRRLRGTVPEVFGDRLVPVSFSRLGATHRLTSWIRLLALAASHEERSWTAHTVGRPTSTRAPGAWATSLLGPVDHRAVHLLGDLVALRDAGLCEPLPLPLKASLSYARVRRTQGSVDEALRKAGWDWDDGRYPGECSDPAHVAAWGRAAGLPGLDRAPGPGEEAPGETSRFGALAMRLWGPLLTSEQGSW